MIHLRLVSFPDVANFAHPQPLQIETREEQSWQIPDVFSQNSPAPNVGEFDLEETLWKLPLSQLNLTMIMKDGTTINLAIPPEVVSGMATYQWELRIKN